MSHFPTCVMHRILVIRTIQGDQNVRRLHRDADLKMAGERREKKTIPWHRTFPCTHGALRPQTLQMFTTTSTPQTTNQTNFSLSSTPPRSNQRKSDQKQKSWSGARRALRSAPSTPPPRRSKSHAPAADSRELLLQLVQATNLLQLLQARRHGHTGVSRMRRMHVCARDCLSCAGRGAVTGKARTNGGEPLAHLWSQEEPIRDALELVRVVDLLATSPRSPATHAQKGGKKYHLLRSVVD